MRLIASRREVTEREKSSGRYQASRCQAVHKMVNLTLFGSLKGAKKVPNV